MISSSKKEEFEDGIIVLCTSVNVYFALICKNRQAVLIVLIVKDKLCTFVYAFVLMIEDKQCTIVLVVYKCTND